MKTQALFTGLRNSLPGPCLLSPTHGIPGHGKSLRSTVLGSPPSLKGAEDGVREGPVETGGSRVWEEWVHQ